MPRLLAPFPYYGGKSRWAETVWESLGDVEIYSEPFAGSLAVLLRRPPYRGREVVCDTEGHVVNFWRALRAAPAEVAYHADYPSFQDDLTARHGWLREWARECSDRLTVDPEYYDTKAAGWWCWGMSNWIGGRFCAPDETSEKIPNMGGRGHGGRGTQAAREQVPNMGGRGQGGRGVQTARDKIPSMEPNHGGRGVQMDRDAIEGAQVASSSDCAVGDGSRLVDWFEALAQRLAHVVVLRRSWESAVTDTVLMRKANTEPKDVGIFLDPPYRDGEIALYESDRDGSTNSIAEAAWQWALDNGERYRIAYASVAGDYALPSGWTELAQSFTGVGNTEKRDALRFSPACLGHKRLF